MSPAYSFAMESGVERRVLVASHPPSPAIYIALGLSHWESSWHTQEPRYDEQRHEIVGSVRTHHKFLSVYTRVRRVLNIRGLHVVMPCMRTLHRLHTHACGPKHVWCKPQWPHDVLAMQTIPHRCRMACHYLREVLEGDSESSCATAGRLHCSRRCSHCNALQNGKECRAIGWCIHLQRALGECDGP